MLDTEFFKIDRWANVIFNRIDEPGPMGFFAPSYKIIQLIGKSFGFNIDAPVGQVFYKSRNTCLPGFLSSPPPEANSLNLSGDTDLIQQLLVHYLPCRESEKPEN